MGDAHRHGKVDSTAKLGSMVRNRRKAAGVRQAEAAGLLGVGTRFLSELERGKGTAEIGKVLQVLERLGLEVWVLPKGSVQPETRDG